MEAALRQAIITAQFQPGQRLSAEALAETFDVSPTPVREALARLAGQNLVTSQPQRGVRVAEFSLVEMEEIYEVRSLIEPLAVERSVLHLDDDARLDLQARYEHMLEQAADGIRHLDGEQYTRYEDAHMAFHRATLSKCGSSWLLRLSSMLSDHSLRYRFASLWLRDRYESIADEHAEILDACLAGDSARASAAHFRHLDNTRAAVRALDSSSSDVDAADPFSTRHPER